MTDHVECRCNGWELWRNSPDEFRQSVLPRKRDEDGYLLCPFCGKIEYDPINFQILAKCPECGKLFKGYKKFPSIDYECTDCE